MEKEAILCPGKEHIKYKKVLLFKSNDEIFVNCKKHGWIGITFKIAGKPISFKDTAIQLRRAPWPHIENVEASTLSIGPFGKSVKK